MTRFRLAAIAAPLSLALAACGSGDDTADGLPTGEPIAHIAAPAGESWVETAAVTPEGGVAIGNPNAPLKLVEYASHTCGGCAAFSQDAAHALDEYVATGVISYEIRNLVRDPIDLTIALLARCGGPGTFHPLANQAWSEFNTVMGTVQANNAALQQALQVPDAQRLQAVGQVSGLLDFFAARGISRDQAMQCLADTAQAQQIVQNSNTQSEELRVNSTPTFFLNGRLVNLSGGTVWPQVEAALQAAGAR